MKVFTFVSILAYTSEFKIKSWRLKLVSPSPSWAICSDIVIFPTQRLCMVFENVLHLIIVCPSIDRQHIWINFKVVICPYRKSQSLVICVLPCQVYHGKCAFLYSFRFPDLYFAFLKKCSALYLQTGPTHANLYIHNLFPYSNYSIQLGITFKEVVHTFWPCKPRTHVFTVRKVWVVRHACTCASFCSNIT
jgi:hypothetical protein